jgi:hypothetical protein
MGAACSWEGAGVVLVRATDVAGAVSLAQRLQDPSRLRTLVVVSTPFDVVEPYFDLDALADQLGRAADLAVLRSGAASTALRRHMPDRTAVFGGAARVYPPTEAWAEDPAAAPLLLADHPDRSGRRTERLAQIALLVATSTSPRPSGTSDQVDGVVQSILSEGQRALVRLLEGEIASVAAEVTVPGVPLDRVLIPGMTVSGDLDSRSRQLDIRRLLRPSDEALAHYSVGDVVLVDVIEANRDAVDVLLYPGVPVQVPADEVTDNPLDDVTDLVAVGEHVPARVTGRDPWSLRMADVDDDEPVLPAPAVIDGGPPWLIPEVPDRDWAALALNPPAEPWQPGESARRPAALVSIALPDVRPGEVPSPPTREQLPRPLARAQAGRGGAADLAAARGEARDAQRQLTRVHAELEALERRKDQLERELKKERQASAALRRAARSQRTADGILAEAMPLFHDREQGFRAEVLLAWARRFPTAEQVERPMQEYRVGAGFLDSLRLIEGISVAKVVDVVVELLTGVAEESDSRELRPYRVDEKTTSPQRVREDGATAWRVSLQRYTPAARRLHFWRLPGGTIELWDVKDHDDHRH